MVHAGQSWGIAKLEKWGARKPRENLKTWKLENSNTRKIPKSKNRKKRKFEKSNIRKMTTRAPNTYTPLLSQNWATTCSSNYLPASTLTDPPETPIATTFFIWIFGLLKIATKRGASSSPWKCYEALKKTTSLGNSHAAVPFSGAAVSRSFHNSIYDTYLCNFVPVRLISSSSIDSNDSHANISDDRLFLTLLILISLIISLMLESLPLCENILASVSFKTHLPLYENEKLLHVLRQQHQQQQQRPGAPRG